MSGKLADGSAGAWPLVVSLLAAILLAAIIGHVLIRMPVGFGDNFDEIVGTYRSPLTVKLADEFYNPGVYFRPFESIWRYLIAYGFGQGIFGYGLFATVWLGVVLIAFALVCFPRDGRDLVAFLVALAVLIGHHAMQATWEFNIVISNGVVLAVGIIAIGLIRRPATRGGQICAVLLTALCLLTKEVGLVIAGVFVLAQLLQMPGVRRGTGVTIALMVLAYLVFHFYTLPDLSTNGKHETNLVAYLSNFITTFAMFWIGAPVDGDWAEGTRFIAQPWQWIQFAAGPATLILMICAWRLAPSSIERETYDAPPLDPRWFALFGFALFACSALGFYYTRHRHGAPAVPLLAYCTYLSMRVLLWRLDCKPLTARPSPLLAGMAVAGLACALLWPLRVVTGFEFARALSAKIRVSWHDHMITHWNDEESFRRPFLVPFGESVDMMPWARRSVLILELLGKNVRDSVNR